VRIAIVSDIHADAKALQRVFDDMPSVDGVLCAGDVCSDYRFCPETVSLLRKGGALCIKGNHESNLFEGRNPAYLDKCRAQFAREDLDFLAQAPVTLDLELQGARVHMVHATPWNAFSGYVYPGSPELLHFGSLPHDIVILGHTHVPMVERVGSVMIINPGSPSQPRDGDRRGSYAVLDIERREVTIHRLCLD